jgi:hypothetical protein
VDASGAYAAFEVPPDASPGIYYLKVTSAAGIDSTNNEWIAVDSMQTTRTIVTPDMKSIAARVYPGQTVTGTLTGTNPLNAIADYDYYYFVATAGSTISVAMNRVDTSIPWENPASLDPQLEIISPDGFVYQNLQSIDNQPAVDLNASLTNAILPETGLYIIAAETTRGSGQYQLAFNVTAMAPAPVGNRAIPIAGNFATLPLNAPVNTAAVMLDARGWPVAGASVTFTSQNRSGDTGTASFTDGTATTTQLDGSVAAVVQMTSPGRARFKPTFNSPQFTQLLYRPSEAAMARPGNTYDAKTDEIVVPRYRAVVRRSIKVLSAQGTGLLLKESPRTAIAVEQLGTREQGRTVSPPGRSALATGPPSGTSAPTPGASRIQPRPLSSIRYPLVITSCGADLEVFSETGVSASQINLPFTVDLTDLSPVTGQTVANGLVDPTTGIQGHRITAADGTQNTIRLQIDIKDSTGNEPTYPVLVSLSLAGPHSAQPGTLILDPDGAKIECANAAFIWHERDAQGNIIALNEEIEYRYGTYAAYVGAIADPQNPGHTLPVWGTTESLSLTLYTVDSTGNPSPTTVFNVTYDVHPEPGKPDHFACFDYLGVACGDVFQFWTGYLATQTGTGPGGVPVLGAGFQIYDAYFLADLYGNTTFGYTNAMATQPASNVTVAFNDETTTGPNFSQYVLTTSWTNFPTWPATSLSSTLGVSYPTDPDWQAGSITKTITYEFDSGTTHALSRFANYDLVRPDGTPGITDGAWGTFPISVSPGGETANLPKTEAGDVQRFVLLAYDGQTIPPPQNVPGQTQQPEPYSAGSRTWCKQGAIWAVCNQTPDPHLAVTDRPPFRLTLIDEYWNPVTTGSLRAWTCPRFDHEPALNQPCTDPPVVSNAKGVIDSITLTKGYLGLELTKAPTAPGTYYVLVESLDQSYRVRRESDYGSDTSNTADEFKGAFALCAVTGGSFLDGNFQSINPYIVDEDTEAYFRYDAGAGAPGTTVTITSTSEADPTQTASINVPLTRLVQSATYLSDAFTLHPPVVTPPSAQATQRRSAAVGSLLAVFGPATKLHGVPSGQAPSDSRAIVNGMTINLASLYRGQGYTGSFTTLPANTPAYLGDDLKLTAGWTDAQSYDWDLAVDGIPYIPPGGLDHTASVKIAPLALAGDYRIHLRANYPTHSYDAYSELDVWLETAPTVIFSWIDGSDEAISPALYSGSHLVNACDVELDVLAAAAWGPLPVNLLNLCPPGPPVYWSGLDINRAIVLTVKWANNPTPSATTFDSAPQATQFMTSRDAMKFGQINMSRFRVRDGLLQSDATSVQGTRAASFGVTELQDLCGHIPVQFGLSPQRGPLNDQIEQLYGVAGLPLAYRAISKPSMLAQLLSFDCWLGHDFPWIWSRSAYLATDPLPLTDKSTLDWCSNFPTTWVYVPPDFATTHLRTFPVVQDPSRTNGQVPDPMSFIQAPNVP